MANRDQVEFWQDGAPFLVVDSSLAPHVGDLVSIKGETYEVRTRNIAVDYSDSWGERRMRLVVQLEKPKAKKRKARQEPQS